MSPYDTGVFRIPSNYDTDTFVSEGKINTANKTIAELKAQVSCLERQIDMVDKWFLNNAPELHDEGNACDNAVRLLNYYVNSK